MKSSATLIAGALLATAALLAGCSQPPAADGPLGDGGIPGGECTPSPLGQPVTMGFYVLENKSSDTVTIQNVYLPSPHTLTMTKAWLLPIYHDPATGSWDVIGVRPWPPAGQPEWANRRPAVGGTIKPGQDLNLVFGVVRKTTKAGSSGGAVIVYSAGGRTFTLREKWSMQVAAGAVCPVV